MICPIYVNSLILFVIMVLMIRLVRMGHVTIVFNSNIIVLIMMFVVISIFIFVGYYIGIDISNENFKLLKVTFLRLIVIILVSFGIVIFVR